MNKIKSIALGLMVTATLFTTSCDKDDNAPEPDVTSGYDNIDLAITFNRYEKDSLYVTNTIQNEFKITNHSDKTIKAGDTLKLACQLNDLKFNLDLTSSEPSGVVLEEDLAPNQTYVHNPGYLYGDQMLAYFGKDTLTVSVLVYGVNNTAINDAFSNDPNPDNNKATLQYTSEGIKIKK